MELLPTRFLEAAKENLLARVTSPTFTLLIITLVFLPFALNTFGLEISFPDF